MNTNDGQPKGTGFRPASHFATNDEQGKYGKEVRQVPPVDDATRDRIFDRVNAHQVAMDEAEAKAATAPLLPTEENLGFKFDLNDPHVDISSASSELASSFALWFGDDVRNWHPEEIADAALRFGIASGELMVRKTVRWEFGSGASATCECGYIALKEHDGNSNFCPCCGSNVIEG